MAALVKPVGMQGKQPEESAAGRLAGKIRIGVFEYKTCMIRICELKASSMRAQE